MCGVMQTSVCMHMLLMSLYLFRYTKFVKHDNIKILIWISSQAAFADIAQDLQC
ncbi:hypothetical protein PGTUg99_016888 [Puccinia graminis f. sp. tritici]|uniref:Uncharacterized protein n=1 Tax=Puccinia graminis f. sp. tritici TaxID=56615 RepID=A0A5B0PIB5_PUCGR|nr:hypothetical protein PGTUg99_016888 [Puccinia graminis f. sp. tritici]